MFKRWVKILPFFVVERLAIKYGARHNIDGWLYVRAFGPSDDKGGRLGNVLIEADVADRADWNERDREIEVSRLESKIRSIRGGE